MVFWETAEAEATLDPQEIEFARFWKTLPKVVFTHSLTSVEGNTRIATGSLEEEINRLRAEPGDGVIAIGGADLAAQAADLGLIDEYRMRLYPVLVGGEGPTSPTTAAARISRWWRTASSTRWCTCATASGADGSGPAQRHGGEHRGGHHQGDADARRERHAGVEGGPRRLQQLLRQVGGKLGGDVGRTAERLPALSCCSGVSPVGRTTPPR
nr:dihydrofolate reductase family protein [Tessaracoccus coleopterorum]